MKQIPQLCSLYRRSRLQGSSILDGLTTPIFTPWAAWCEDTLVDVSLMEGEQSSAISIMVSIPGLQCHTQVQPRLHTINHASLLRQLPSP